MNYVNILIFLFSIFSGIAAANGAPGKAQAWVKVEPLNPIAVKGEPIYFRTTKYGTPYAGDLYLDGRRCQRPYPDMGDRPEPTPGSQNTAPAVPQFNPTERNSVGPLSSNCDLRLKDMESREYELCYEDPWVKGCARFQLREPFGEDAKAYARMNKEAYDYSESSFSGLSPQEIIKEYPTSIYAGWVLRNWRSDLPGVFVKNETAILAAVTRNKEDMDKHWRLDLPLPEGEKIKDKKVVMKKLIEASESFVNAHPDFSFSGWILARAGFNALGLGDFGTACVDLKRSLELGWKFPDASQKEIDPAKEGTTYALELLRQHGYCKKD
jgi:hypothetical protein